ncbi:hypothetical protein QFC20_000588 [Naganishia adeliensis]|uniref:Uncharacterized protein n=1 Tax=Naganishia adeliensis TaxID=92952 RepID=A0ACC2WZT4_9TREE|nr:hypothetical protein QFC20_000588 [Naganishia adeliensis]
MTDIPRPPASKAISGVSARPHLHQSDTASHMESLVAPLLTHGLLAEPENGTQEARTFYDSGYHANASGTRNQHNLEAPRHYDQTSMHRHDDIIESMYNSKQNLHTQADIIIGSEERTISHTTSATLENATTRNTSKRGSASHNEALIGGSVGQVSDDIPSTRQVVSMNQGTSYPPASSSHAPRTRKYHRLHQQPMQDTHFFLKGHLVTGGDNIWPIIGSIILVLGLGGLWLGTTGVWIWRDGLGGGGAGRGGKAAVIIFGYLLGVCFGAMMATAFGDPEI